MPSIRLSPAASVTPTDDGVLLRSASGTYRLDGADVRLFVEQMLPLLDGTRDPDAIAAALPASRASVLSFLELLRQQGIAEAVPDGAGERWLPQQRFFQAWEADEAGERLRSSRVLVAGMEPWGAVAATELAAAGVGALHLADERDVTPEDLLAVRSWGEPDVGRPRRDALADGLAATAPWSRVTASALDEIAGDYDLLVCGLGGDDRYWLRRAAAWAHEHGVPSLGGHVDGQEAWIGPGVVPGQTACWNCFRLRRLAATELAGPARDIDAGLIAAPAPRRAAAGLAPMAAQAGHIMAMEAVKLLTGFAPSKMTGRVLVHDLVANEATYHKVIPVPWCEVCGGPGEGAEPGRLGAADVESVEQLNEQLEGWVDERVGVLRSLVDTGGSGPLQLPRTAMAVMADDDHGHRHHHHGTAPQVGAGKGLTAVAAHLSAVGEAIERYSAAQYRVQDLRRASYLELGDEALDPRRLCLYADEQYDEPGFPYRRFSAEQPIHWVEGRWLGGGPVWVPALVAFFNFRAPPEEYFCQVTSNGLAAGADEDDAALRATFELVERDAAMLTWLCRLPGRRLLLDDAVDPGARQVVAELGEHGVDVELYAIDAGIDIPAVLGIGLGDGSRWPATMVSMSAHADPAVAAVKAILELGHVAPYLAGLMPQAAVPETPADVVSMEDHALYYVPVERREVFDFLRKGGEPAVAVGDLEALPEPWADACAERLAAAGVRVAIVDATSPDVAQSPFRVARAVGTDVQPIHFGHRLRRLANPRIDALLAGREVNPHPHPVP